MSGPEYPEAPPPEVPEEFADAYRLAYQRALESAGGPVADLPEPAAAEDGAPPELRRDAVGAPPARDASVRAAAAQWLRSRWFRPLAFAALALVLVVAAYGVGTALSGDQKPDTAAPQHATTTRTDRPAGNRPTRSTPSTSPGGWDGPVRAVSVDAISADCTAPPSQDSAGRRVTYVPQNAIDDQADTAWRCPGTAVGEKLTLRLAAGTDVAEVGLVPGYAKTDPESGADRYAENNRITKVRWTLAPGVTVVQRLDPDPSSRAVQLIRVPRTTTDTITLEILAVERGPRDATAISEVSLSAAK